MLARMLARLRRPEEPPTGLHTCVLCGSDYANPVDWVAVSAAHWWIRLRCGDCETFREVTVENDVAARFEVELNERSHILASTLDAIDRRAMAADVAAMIEALRRGVVCAADFAV